MSLANVPSVDTPHRRRGLARKRWWAALAFLLVIAGSGLTVSRVFASARAVNPRVTVGEVFSVLQDQADVPGSLAYKVHNGIRVNILLLGYGGVGHDGAYLTDSIMVLSVQGANRVALTSIPRDTYVSIPAFANGASYDGKINAAYELPLANGSFGAISPEYNTGFDGAGRLASKVVGDYLGLNIDYFVGVDFTAFKAVVDAVGGIDVVNPTVLDDYTYPAAESGGYTHIHFDAGPLHLNGDQALIYVRERHADSDFGRSRRQQQVIAAIKDKAVSVGAVPQLLALLDAVSNNVHTNMSPNDLRVFSGMASVVSSPATHRVSIDNTNWQYDTTTWASGYILLRRDPSGAALKRYVQAEMVDPTVTAEGATIQVVSGPTQYSQGEPMSATWTGLLQMLNFNTVAPAESSVSPASTVVHDRSGGAATATARWLADYYGGTISVEAPLAGGAQLVVQLGTDFSPGLS